MKFLDKIWDYLETGRFSEHITIGRLTIYGFNAMHVAVNFWTKESGYFCFHPPMYCFGKWWPWYFYVSKSATPWEATFAIGPGVSNYDKEMARVRRKWPLCSKCTAHVESPGSDVCWRHSKDRGE